MRNVVMYHLMSLDGVAEEPSNWVFAFDEQAQDNLERIIGEQDDVLLGHNTYDYWVGYWPTSDVEPFASFINVARKHVFASTALTLDWAHSSCVTQSAADYVRELKTAAGRNIGVHGSIHLSQSLLRAGLVDEVHLVIAPTLAGEGRRLFEERVPLRRMDLIDLNRTSSGLVLASYSIAHAP